MSFSKALQSLTTDEERARYMRARTEYSKACSMYTRIRMLADHPAASDEDILAHHKAKKAFKIAARHFYAARVEFVEAVRSRQLKIPVLTDKEYLDAYEQLSMKDVMEAERQQSIANDPDVQRLIKELQETERQKQELRDQNDPTFGDFEPLPPTKEGE